MSEETEIATIQCYCSIMDEIKFRLDWIKNVIHAKIPISGTIGRDLGYLELRMVCELIALGCLAAHGDIKETRGAKLTRRYEADFLIAAMAKLHPTFYPQPMLRIPNQVPVPDEFGIKFRGPPPLTSGFLTQSDLRKLYHTCGEKLHRGNLNDILGRKKIENEFSSIGKTVDKIVRLLDYHRIRLIDQKKEIWVEMSGPIGGKAYAGKVERTTPPNVR